MSKADTFNPLETTELLCMNGYFEDLLKLHNSEKFPKVMLISGEKGSGKFTLVNHFLNYIFSKDTYNLKEKVIDEESKVYKDQLNGVFLLKPSYSRVQNLRVQDRPQTRLLSIPQLTKKVF